MLVLSTAAVIAAVMHPPATALVAPGSPAMAVDVPGLVSDGAASAPSVTVGVQGAHPAQVTSGFASAIVPLCGWAAPVDAPVVDPFRAPPHRYGAGNRGLEYGVADGVPVRAAAAGVVGFQGSVAGRRYVTIDHGGGVRSAYGPVAAPAVGVGERVAQGQLLAEARVGLHLTVRVDGSYVDPAPLLVGGCGSLRLVPPPSDW